MTQSTIDCKRGFLNVRTMMFLALCIPSRVALAMWVRGAPVAHLPYIGIALLIPAIDFAAIYAFSWRKLYAFGCRIWWNSLRPVHATLYLLAAALALWGDARTASLPLFVDATISLLSYALNQVVPTNTVFSLEKH